MAIINVTAGRSLQVAIDIAFAGDTINVEAGAVFFGPIELPAKTGEAEIVIQSSRAADLPNGRINPSHSGLMPKILTLDATQADNNQSIRTRPGAHHYKLDGIECLPDVNAVTFYDLVRFGGNRHDQQSFASVPHHLTIDRCYIHGLPQSSFQRGISFDSMLSTVTRSYVSEIHGRGMDSQAIWLHNTPGGNDIIDCYLEAAGENVMFGGADPCSAEFIPSDCRILRCHMFKPLAWKTENAKWTVKNLLELKIGKRILIDGCILENNWGGQRVDGSDWGQSGIAVLFTVRNQDGTAPYSVILDVVFTNNTVKNAQGALNFLGSDNEKPSLKASAVTLRNNVFDKITGPFITINGYDLVVLEKNTHLQTCLEGCNTATFYGAPSRGFVYRDNLTIEKPYGIRDDSGSTVGKATLDKWAPGHVFAGNVIGNPYDNQKIAGNEYPASVVIGPDYSHGFTGKGADIDALLAAQAGSSPIPAPPLPTPTPTSPDGTKAISIVDATGGEWTIGPLSATLRNGIHMDHGQGVIYKWLGGVVYVQGNDTRWYKWMVTFWSLFGTVEPGITPPTPKPVPTIERPPVDWPKQISKQNEAIEAQWKDGYHLRRIIEGIKNKAQFEKVE